MSVSNGDARSATSRLLDCGPRRRLTGRGPGHLRLVASQAALAAPPTSTQAPVCSLSVHQPVRSTTSARESSRQQDPSSVDVHRPAAASTSSGNVPRVSATGLHADSGPSLRLARVHILGPDSVREPAEKSTWQLFRLTRVAFVRNYSNKTTYADEASRSTRDTDRTGRRARNRRRSPPRHVVAVPPARRAERRQRRHSACEHRPDELWIRTSSATETEKEEAKPCSCSVHR